MAHSILSYPGSAGFGPYTARFTLGKLRDEYVKCRVNEEVDGLGDPVYRDIEWISDTLINITSGDEPTGADTVQLIRTIPDDELIHDYTNGAVINEENLDESNLQTIMLVHQFLDGRLTAALQNDLDMGGHKIINLAEGEDPEDAVNFSQISPLIDAFEDIEQSVDDAEDAAAAAIAAKNAAETAETNAETAETNAETAETNAEAAAVAAAAGAAAALVSENNAETAETNAETAETNAEAAAVAADASADAAAASAAAALASELAAADSETNAAASEVAAGISESNASASEIAAAASAASAASAAAEGLYNDVANLTFADSPYTPIGAQEGTLFRVDTSGGNVVINLSTLATYGEDTKFAFVKTTADANTITVNRGGSDTIDSGTSKTLDTQFVVVVLVGDLTSTQWISCVQTQSIADGAVTFAKMQDIGTDKLMGRDASGSGDPTEIGVGGGIEFTGSNALQVSAFTGDVTKSAGSSSLTIPNDTVTYAKMQNTSAASKLLGRGSASGAGDLEEITLGTNLSMSGTTLNAAGNDPVTSVDFFDDMHYNRAAITNTTGSMGDRYYIAMSGASSQFIASCQIDHGASGRCVLSTGSATTGSGSMFMGTASAGSWTPSTSGGYSAEWRVKVPTLSDGTNRYTLCIGLRGTATAANDTIGIYFRYSDNINSGKWQAFTDSDGGGGTNTNADTGVTVTTGWFRLRVEINASNNSATFYIDDTLVATLTTTIPASHGPGLLILKSAGSSPRDLYVDYLRIRQASRP